MYDTYGKFLRKFGGYGAGPGQLNVTRALALDRLGNVLVCDRNNNRISCFTPQGAFLTAVSTIGDEQLMHPITVHVDDEGRVMVADNSYRIRVFGFEP